MVQYEMTLIRSSPSRQDGPSVRPSWRRRSLDLLERLLEWLARYPPYPAYDECAFFESASQFPEMLGRDPETRPQPGSNAARRGTERPDR